MILSTMDMIVIRPVVDKNHANFAQTYSGEFDVSLGDAYKIDFIRHPGTAFGGQVFSASPVVGVVDRGGNVISDWNDGSISASLSTSPTGSEALLPATSLSVNIVDGLATFDELYINKAGYPYQMTFNCSRGGFDDLVSKSFDVAVGSPAFLSFANGTEPSSSSKYAGEFFRSTPRVHLRDRGGNLVAYDSSSALNVSLYGNPTGAELRPVSSLFPVAVAGVVSLSAMMVSRPGLNYTLQFQLYNYSALTNKFTETAVYLISEKFDVTLGPARGLQISTAAADAWAGNQAIGVQPVVQLVDLGGNIVSTDYSTSVGVSILTSLSLDRSVRVDTFNSSIPTIVSVSTLLADGVYGAGHIVDFTMTFEARVFVSPSEVEGNVPHLVLNVLPSSPSGMPVVAVLTSAMASWTTSLSFRYVVAQGDAVSQLDYKGSDAFVLNGTSLFDGNGRVVNTTLPLVGLSASHNIVINTQPPVVVQLGSSSADDVYAAGDVLDLFVLFDQPVVVQGMPYLNLSARANNSKHALAVYSYTESDGYRVHFDYSVGEGDSSVTLSVLSDHLDFFNLTANATVVTFWNHSETGSYNYSYALSNEISGDIRRLSDRPTTLVDYTLSSSVRNAFVAAHSLVIDTSAPRLELSYGVQTTHRDGQFYPGEHILLTVRFDRPVVTFGDGIFLVLECGPKSNNVVDSYQGFAFVDRLLADNRTLQFLYVAERNTNCSRLDIAEGDALRITEQAAFIKLKSMHPIVHANLSTAQIRGDESSLGRTSAISLAGFAPFVSNVSITHTHPAGASVLYPDDSVFIQVRFTAPVYANCSPVLVITAGFLREATYFSGNNTDTFVFKYTVAVGDSSSDLIGYRNTPYALCPVSGCPYPTQCKMLANSTAPSLPVNLRFRKPYTAFHDSVRIGNQTIESIPLHRSTNITGISCLEATGLYGPGSVFHFRVDFSDIVQLKKTSQVASRPKLLLNSNRYATYSGGSSSRSLSFTYISRANDSLAGPHLIPMAVSGTHSALVCLSANSCNVTNQAGLLVNLNTSSFSNLTSIITLSATAPVVTSVWSSKATSPYTTAEYSVGEQIAVFVAVSRPVLITGFDPRLLMDVGVDERYALYNASLSSPQLLLGDVTSSLKYSGVDALDLRGGKCVIYLVSSIPEVVMDTTLPVPQSLALGANVISINSLDTPTVLSVVSLSASGRYFAGDVITIRVDFSKAVVACGHSFILLNTGDHTSLARYVGYAENAQLLVWTPSAVNTPSNATLRLFYQYTVAAGDISADLDYTDSHALFPGLTDHNDFGYIRDASSSARLAANLDLPEPGKNESLSADGVAVTVDGRAPYLTGIAFSSPDGVYGVNSTVEITLNFSSPVVVQGVPSILLETGEVDGEAFYARGNGSRVLFFAFVPQPGDYSESLDYHAQRELFGSASQSFRYNGGRVMAASANPVQDADIWLNPPRGQLTGTVESTLVAGEAVYTDLLMTLRGPDYLVRYSSVATDVDRLLTVTQPLYVSFSSEYQLRPREAQVGELVGQSVDIFGNIAIVGAPNTNRSVTTIQTITSAAALGSETQKEVQVIQTTIDPQPACQLFHTTADVGESVGGTFSISYQGLGPSGPIPFNADPTVLSAILLFDLPSLGTVTVTKQPYTFCACDNAFTWSLTFNDLTEGVFGLLSFDFSKLTGTNAAIVGPVVVQSSALLAGTFTIGAYNKVSSAIPFDATTTQMSAAVAELGLTATDVYLSPTSTSRTRMWSITFEEFEESYEIPLLAVNGDNLTGGTTGIWAEIVRPGVNGPRGIGGYFQLQWRGNTTARLLANASADDVKYALESLPVVNLVNVNRSVISIFNGYTWIVEFVSVNVNTPRGYEVQTTRNLEPIVPINNLISTNATLVVGARWLITDRTELFLASREGTYGEGAGAAYVFQRFNESWEQVASLVGNDTSDYNRFGTSVSLYEDVLLVGAVGASMNGVPERQAIFCNADSGFFQIAFRGWQTDQISFNVTRSELVDFIVANTDSFSHLYSVVSIDIEDWGTGGLCDNNTALITFYAPVDGNALLFPTDTGPDLELLTMINTNLTRVDNATAVLQITSVQNGTWVVHGSNADKQQIGSAYLFRAHYSCVSNSSADCVKSNWTQEAQLFPSTSPVASRFGTSVALWGNIAVVGAPGSNQEQGYAYVFEYDIDTFEWSQLQLMKDPTIANGDGFGTAVAVSGSTIVVSAPFFDSNTGAVYVYKRTSIGGTFIASQTLLPLAAVTPLSPGDLYGASLSVDNNLIAVGASQYDDTTVYLGSEVPSQAREDSGVVLVFERVSSASNFVFLQKLTPSNVRTQDRFGHSVRIDGANLVASSVEDFQGNLTAAKTIVQITTQATYNRSPVGGYFKLKWLTTSITDSSATYTTQAIPHDISAPRLRALLENDLPGIGSLLVSRTLIDRYDGGFAWRVTFAGLDSTKVNLFQADNTLLTNLFQADNTLLTGTNASVQVVYLTPTPPELRGLTHFFQRDPSSTLFAEQLFLSPYKHQAVDRCGEIVSISGSYAFVGCPNRDLAVAGQNSGAAFIYDLRLAALEFTQSDYPVSEGSSVEVALQHNAINNAELQADLYFYLLTVDRNSQDYLQRFLSHLYGVMPTAFTYPQTAIDYIGLFGQAVARSQFYGTSLLQTSQWVDGMFDYRAIGDYVAVNAPHMLLLEQTNTTQGVDTNADTILEKPDEQVGVVVSVPGAWPSVFGRLYRNIVIEGGEDGFAEVPQYSKLYDADSSQADANFGAAVSICEELAVMVTGAPLATVNGRVRAGKVVVYRSVRDGVWTQQSAFTSPTTSLNGSSFGDSVAVGRIAQRNVSILAVGEPGANRVHVYSTQGDDFASDEFVLEATLSVPEAILPQHRFGEAGSVGLFGYVLVVGAPGLETVYVFRRVYNDTASAWYWTKGAALVSEDYDEDVIDSVTIPHRQGFGSAVALSGRSIVVGAPYADYNKLGSSLEETDWATEGTDILAYGRGKAYVFYSTPAEQLIRIVAPEQLLTGEFRLNYAHQGINETTAPLQFDMRESAMEAALSALSNIDSVTVTASSSLTEDGGYQYSWTVTFTADWMKPGILTPLWKNFGCGNCSQLSHISTTPADQIQVTVVADIGDVAQQQALMASDRRNGNRFGWSVAVDGNQIVVGAPYSASLTTTSWDFEAGSLLGWKKSGNAFDYQPTFGDNSYLHAVRRPSAGSNARAQSQASGMQGRYYIATAERRPGNPSDYSTADPLYAQGSNLGDAPTGTLSSDVFLVPEGGTTIKFLIGGGCDIYLEYVELLVDGMSVARRTGRCSEKLLPASFDVSSLNGRAAQIRIVDQSSANWGHINVDSFQFDWDVSGASITNENNKVSSAGVVETPRSGAIYLYRRHAGSSATLQCLGSENTCVWTEEIIFAASDKRANIFFGHSVAVNDEAGIVAVGAPNAAFTGFYKEAPSVYPFQNSTTGNSDASGLVFPVASAHMPLFESSGAFVPERSGAFGVWTLRQTDGVLPDSRAYEQSGAVYTFSKIHATVSNTGVITVPQIWRPVEHAKVQSPDAFARDVFGSSVALSGTSLAVGAPGQDGNAFDAGALYLYRVVFAAITFSEIEYAVSEGRSKLATVTLLRDPDVYAGLIVLEYATSDLTARGVDSSKFDECMLLSVRERAPVGCGDYEQSTGLVVIEPGDMSGGFTVRIMDDLCYERFMEYIQVTISVPGSAALQGETLSAKVRIDDNDFGFYEC
eukprot:gene23126-29319_t